MVFSSLDNYEKYNLEEQLHARGIKINSPEAGEYRFVTHYWVTRREIDLLVNEMKKYAICN